jgi:subtilase family serine protease
MRKVLFVALAVALASCSGAGNPPQATHVSVASSARVDAPFAYAAHPKIAGNLNFSNCVATTQCATPTVLRTGYSFPSSATGAGRTIMIVDAFGSPTIAADVNRFSSDNGLPPPDLTIYYPGGKPSFNPNQATDVTWAEETTLDVEWAHAAAPAAKIALILSANDQGQSIQSAQQFAIQTVRGDVLSLSFGVQESSINGGANNTQLQQAHQIYQQANAQHITVIASAGDFGALGGFPSPNAQFPASDPYVLAVGGTNLILFHNDSYRNESVWNDADNCLSPCLLGPSGATGGAPSIIFTPPPWQTNALNAYNAASSTKLSAPLMRTSSDVAYNASPNTGVAVYIGFGDQVPSLGKNGYYAVGGTSQGPPQWAGIVAAVNQLRGSNFGCLNASLYAIGANGAGTKSALFHDVVSGDNFFPAGAAGYRAAAGWDPPTGLGSPQVTNLISALSTTTPLACP